LSIFKKLQKVMIYQQLFLRVKPVSVIRKLNVFLPLAC
jgi:hypothetical protein